MTDASLRTRIEALQPRLHDNYHARRGYLEAKRDVLALIAVALPLQHEQEEKDLAARMDTSSAMPSGRATASEIEVVPPWAEKYMASARATPIRAEVYECWNVLTFDIETAPETLVRSAVKACREGLDAVLKGFEGKPFRDWCAEQWTDGVGEVAPRQKHPRPCADGWESADPGAGSFSPNPCVRCGWSREDHAKRQAEDAAPVRQDLGPYPNCSRCKGTGEEPNAQFRCGCRWSDSPLRKDAAPALSEIWVCDACDYRGKREEFITLNSRTVAGIVLCPNCQPQDAAPVLQCAKTVTSVPFDPQNNAVPIEHDGTVRSEDAAPVPPQKCAHDVLDAR